MTYRKKPKLEVVEHTGPPKPESFESLKQFTAMLQPLDKNERCRVVATVIAFFELNKEDDGD